MSILPAIARGQLALSVEGVRGFGQTALSASDSLSELPDPRHIDVDRMRAQLGAVWCRTCKQECLPLNDGTCGFCDHQVVTETGESVYGPRTGRPRSLTIPHGTTHGYQWHACRCAKCKRAQRDVTRQYRAKQKLERTAA